MRVGLVDITCCGTDSSLLARSRKKLGGRVSESFRGGMLVVCSCGGGGGGVGLKLGGGVEFDFLLSLTASVVGDPLCLAVKQRFLSSCQ